MNDEQKQWVEDLKTLLNQANTSTDNYEDLVEKVQDALDNAPEP